MKKKLIQGGLRLKNKKNYYSSKPEFSIITVVLNDKYGIKKTIKSILKQKLKNFEYLVIDGGSTDGTLSVIKKYSNKIDYWISKKDKGIWDAVNKGIILSRGKYINTINAGDTYYSKNSLKIINNYFKRDKAVDFVFGAGGSEVVTADQSVELTGNAMRIFFFAVGLVVASFAAAAAGFLYMSKRGIRWEFKGSEQSAGDSSH